MEVLYWILIYIQCIFALVFCEERQGTVLFMKAGTDITLSELFYSTNHTETNNIDKHLWGITYLMNGSNFRSPILDRDTELNVTKYEATVYNAAGEPMTSFPFEVTNDGFNSSEGDVDFSEFYNSTSLELYTTVEEGKVRFISSNIQSSEPKGAQFIFTTDQGFHDLPTLQTVDCYRFTTPSLFTSLSETFRVEGSQDCGAYCATVTDSNYALVFTTNITNPLSHRCTCLSNIHNAISVFGSYNDTLCPDDSKCGCAMFTDDDTLVSASVYSMTNINQFLGGLTSPSTSTHNHHLYPSYPDNDRNPRQFPVVCGNGNHKGILSSISVTMDDDLSFTKYLVSNDGWKTLKIYLTQRYVTEVSFMSLPNFNYTLGFADGTNCGPELNFTYYGKHLGTPKIFDASIYETIHPTPTTCLHINFLTTAMSSYVAQITSLSATFTTGEYFRIVAKWTGVECKSKEVVGNSSLIPDAWIDTVQTSTPSDLLYGMNITFPETSKAVMYINVPYNDTRFYVVKSIEFTSDVDVIVVTSLLTNNKCVAIGYGTKQTQDYNNSFTLDVVANTPKSISVPVICAYKIGFTAKVKQVAGNVTTRVHRVAFTIKGCLLKEPNLNAPCDHNDITAQILNEANVSWVWVPNTSLTPSYLRPGGPGLVIYRHSNPYVRIQLSDKHIPIEVTRIVITGDINQAFATIGGVETFMENTTGAILDYPLTNMRGHDVIVDRIHGRSDMDNEIHDFLIIRVAVEICLLSLNPQNSTNSSTATVAPGSGILSTSTTITPTSVITTTSTTVTPSTTTTLESSSIMTTSTTLTPSTTTAFMSSSLITSTTTSTTLMSTASLTLSSTALVSTPTPPHTTSTTSSTSTSTGAPTTLENTTPTKSTFTTTRSTSLTTSSTSTTSSQPSTSSHATTSTHASTSSTSNPPPPTQASSCGVCLDDSLNITKEAIDNLVQQLVQNLTVSRRKTSAFKRSKESMPDERTSAKMVGTAGIAMMTVTAGLIVAMDYTYIVRIFQFVRHLFRVVFVR